MLLWVQSEAFFAEAFAATSLHRDASKVSAIAELQLSARTGLGDEVVTNFKKAEERVATGLGGLYKYELLVKEAHKEWEAAEKAAKSATVALGKAEAGAAKVEVGAAKASEKAQQSAAGSKEVKKKAEKAEKARKASLSAENSISSAKVSPFPDLTPSPASELSLCRA